MKTGIFGGTFNPIHNGHMKIALEFKDKFELDRVLFVPNNISPFKSGHEDIAPAKHRLKMLELALAEYPFFEIDDFEIKRDVVSYTIDTIRFLKKKYKNDEFLLLIGTDQANSFDKWKDFNIILQEVLVVIANRTSFGSKSETTEISSVLKNSVHLNNELINISSSEIRGKVRKGEPIVEYVPPVIAEYIVNHLLYI